MKKIFVISILLFLSKELFAQNFSSGFSYSGLISGKNYVSASFYTLEGDSPILNNLSAGITITIIDARIYKSFIKSPPPENVYESSVKLGVQTKYFPFLFNSESFALKPYIGIELGIYNSYFKTYLNMPSGCSEHYWFETQKSFYTDINMGGIIFSEQLLSFIFGLKYQINNPTVKYDQPICSEDGYGTIGEIRHTEKVKLNVLLWNVGFRINF